MFNKIIFTFSAITFSVGNLLAKDYEITPLFSLETFLNTGDQQLYLSKGKWIVGKTWSSNEYFSFHPEHGIKKIDIDADDYCRDFFITDQGKFGLTISEQNLIKTVDLNNSETSEIALKSRPYYGNIMSNLLGNDKVLVESCDLPENENYLVDLSSGTFDEINGTIKAINGSGQSIGYTDDRSWFQDHNLGLTELGSLDPLSLRSVEPEFLSETGFVAGIGYTIHKENLAFIWSQSNGLIPITPKDLGLKKISKVKGLTDEGEILITGTNRLGMKKAFLYDCKNEPTEIGYLLKRVRIQGCNSQGVVIGTAEPFLGPSYLFVWDKENGMQDLNDLIPKKSYWKSLDEILEINDLGFITGFGTFCGEENQPFVLIPKN